MNDAAKKTIQRIELWHGLVVVALIAALGPMGVAEPGSVAAGGLFMGLNFYLLSCAVAVVLKPLAGKGRTRAAVGLLVLKVLCFLGILAFAFFRLKLEPVSFALGFSALLPAILFETARGAVGLGES
ncbi:MAG TPA: hypothetical protein VNN77_10800 [candidate division Zixibacteria bacterium]|nr:hypothetical protein [candidate division Zixibacteria bacterium]